MTPQTSKLLGVSSPYIDKRSKKYGLENCRGVGSPSYNLAAIYDDENSPGVDFNYREAVGALQRISTLCRPDIAEPVHQLARHSAKPCTQTRERAANAVKKVFKYLANTKTLGPSYSQQGEK